MWVGNAGNIGALDLPPRVQGEEGMSLASFAPLSRTTGPEPSRDWRAAPMRGKNVAHTCPGAPKGLLGGASCQRWHVIVIDKVVVVGAGRFSDLAAVGFLGAGILHRRRRKGEH